MQSRGDADEVTGKRLRDSNSVWEEKRLKVLPSPSLHNAQEDPTVSRGWSALLEAAAGTNGGRARQFTALIELERRSKLITGLGRAEEVFQVCRAPSPHESCAIFCMCHARHNDLFVAVSNDFAGVLHRF